MLLHIIDYYYYYYRYVYETTIVYNIDVVIIIISFFVNIIRPLFEKKNDCYSIMIIKIIINFI